VANSPICFIKLNARITPTSGWLKRVVRPFLRRAPATRSMVGIESRGVVDRLSRRSARVCAHQGLERRRLQPASIRVRWVRPLFPVLERGADGKARFHAHAAKPPWCLPASRPPERKYGNRQGCDVPRSPLGKALASSGCRHRHK
jgi:hypothetical protein